MSADNQLHSSKIASVVWR